MLSRLSSCGSFVGTAHVLPTLKCTFAFLTIACTLSTTLCGAPSSLRSGNTMSHLMGPKKNGVQHRVGEMVTSRVGRVQFQQYWPPCVLYPRCTLGSQYQLVCPLSRQFLQLLVPYAEPVTVDGQRPRDWPDCPKFHHMLADFRQARLCSCRPPALAFDLVQYFSFGSRI